MSKLIDKEMLIIEASLRKNIRSKYRPSQPPPKPSDVKREGPTLNQQVMLEVIYFVVWSLFCFALGFIIAVIIKK